MDGKEAEKLRVRAKELRELAKVIKSEEHRKLLLYAAEKFEQLAAQVLGPERKP